jgi:hypothetical protein
MRKKCHFHCLVQLASYLFFFVCCGKNFISRASAYCTTNDITPFSLMFMSHVLMLHIFLVNLKASKLMEFLLNYLQQIKLKMSPKKIKLEMPPQKKIMSQMFLCIFHMIFMNCLYNNGRVQT